MTTFPHPDTAETRLASTFFVVEASDFEKQELWARYSDDSIFPPWDQRKNCRAFEPVEWESISDGWGVTVGSMGSRPICISVTWARIEGRLVMFWYPTSQVVDTLKCEAWIAEYFKGETCDANNFHQCLNAIREVNKIAP